MSSPHVVVIPNPEQGHVIPLLELSQNLAKHGLRITFVNSEYNHNRVLESLEGKNYIGEQIHLVSIPDGIEPWDDRSDMRKLLEKRLQVMPGKLEGLIEEIHGRGGEKIACLIADGAAGWAIEVAEKMKLRRAVVVITSAATVALTFSIPKLIEDGVINSNGTPIKEQMIQLAPNMPAISTGELFWTRFGDLTMQKIFFDFMVQNMRATRAVDFQLCNSTYELEGGAFSMIPELLPIGPLLASNRLGNSAGYFLPEDSKCVEWLDQQQANSVIYVALGSHTVLEQNQFQELALGLEICNRAFLWVVRPDITNDANDAYPEGFRERVAARGQMISWSPQQKFLTHPSISCFMSHCGWNSTTEGVSNGVPFLCWPFFADQFMNTTYICDVWKVGLRLERNQSGIIGREEIKNKVDQVLGDQNFKARALKLKEKALSSVREGGSSNKAIQNFVQSIKQWPA
uniref:Putative secondary product UDP-glucosyltransferase 11 n=1 Tax=Citrus paradisi TaxID=37656 RepID=A0A0A0QR57_CITPA|nr:putative secondary product UDP-glucosyltransferase 11 [Citrus x paradisi]